MQISMAGIRGPLLVLTGALCFSTSGFLQALAPEGATPYVVAGCRMLLGAFSLYLFLKWRRVGISFRGWSWRYILDRKSVV